MTQKDLCFGKNIVKQYKGWAVEIQDGRQQTGELLQYSEGCTLVSGKS